MVNVGAIGNERAQEPGGGVSQTVEERLPDGLLLRREEAYLAQPSLRISDSYRFYLTRRIEQHREAAARQRADESALLYSLMPVAAVGLMAMLGIVTTKTGKLESKDDLKRRIDEAAKFAPLDQLCISGQCGFASTEEGNLLTEDEQWAKLRRIVEVADEVWG